MRTILLSLIVIASHACNAQSVKNKLVRAAKVDTFFMWVKTPPHSCMYDNCPMRGKFIFISPFPKYGKTSFYFYDKKHWEHPYMRFQDIIKEVDNELSHATI